MRFALLLLALLLQVLTPTGVQVLFGDAPPPQEASRGDWLADPAREGSHSDDANEQALAEQEDGADEDEEGDDPDDAQKSKLWLHDASASAPRPRCHPGEWLAFAGQRLARAVYLHCVQARGPPAGLLGHGEPRLDRMTVPA